MTSLPIHGSQGEVFRASDMTGDLISVAQHTTIDAEGAHSGVSFGLLNVEHQVGMVVVLNVDDAIALCSALSKSLYGLPNEDAVECQCGKFDEDVDPFDQDSE